MTVAALAATSSPAATLATSFEFLSPHTAVHVEISFRVVPGSGLFTEPRDTVSIC